MSGIEVSGNNYIEHIPDEQVSDEYEFLHETCVDASSRPIRSQSFDEEYVNEVMRFSVGAGAVVDQECNIHFSNTAAIKILDNIEFDSSLNGIVCTDDGIQHRLLSDLRMHSLPGSCIGTGHSNLLVPKRNRSGNYVFTFSEFGNKTDLVGVTGIEPSKLFSLRIIDDSDIDQSDFMYIASLFNLSPTEKEILRFVVDGKTNKEISIQHNVSIEAIKNHIKWMLKKTGSSNRAVLIRRTIKLCGVRH